MFNDRAINLNELSVSQTPIPASDVSSIPQIIGGTPSGDNLIGTSVDDEFYSSAGNNVIDGGDGYDTLHVYGGTVNLRGGTNGTGAIPVDQFSVERISDDTVAVAGTTITGDVMQYELTNVERIVFDNDVVYLDGSNGTLAGTGAGEWLATGECTERVQAGGGDDSIYVSNSNIRRVEGGTGIDTLVLDRVSRGDIEIIDARQGFGVYVVFGQQISVDLVDVEFIQFADETLALADIPLGQGSQNYGRSLALPLPLCVHI